MFPRGQLCSTSVDGPGKAQQRKKSYFDHWFKVSSQYQIFHQPAIHLAIKYRKEVTLHLT